MFKVQHILYITIYYALSNLLTPDEIAIIQAAQPVGVGTAVLEDEE
jgi:hypothetical protein